MLVSDIGYINLNAQKYFLSEQNIKIQNKSNLSEGFGHYKEYKPYEEKSTILSFLKSLFFPKTDDCKKSLNLIS